MTPPNDNNWHLDKRVNVSIIVALMGQIFIGGWFISALVADVEGNSKAINRLDGQMEVLRNSSQDQAVQLGRIEEQITALRGDIGRLLAAIERGK